MAAYNKFEAFVADLGLKKHDLNTDTLKLLLMQPGAPTPPVAGDATFDDNTTHQLNSSTATEVANGNGYTAGGYTIPSTSYSQTSGTATMSGTPANPTWTASGSGFSLRYVVFYNSSAGSLGARPVIAWWDYASTLTLSGANGDTFTVSFASNHIFTLT